MILRMYTLSLEPEHPLRFSIDEVRSFLNKKLAEYSALRRNDTAGFIHRYPVLQCKEVKGDLIVTGIGQGAGCLCQLARNETELGAGESRCRIPARDPAIRAELFGITEITRTYEFLTPYLALNQQNAKKFYDLDGKPRRDAFMQKLLTAHLTTLAKSLDYTITSPVSCEAKVRFRRERIHRENVMVFLGKFRTNLRIPDYLGIGQSVSQGYGTITCITEDPKHYSGDS
ncbi:MAG: CRISPR-associated endonuclease Cas6 [Methanoregula sp.]